MSKLKDKLKNSYFIVNKIYLFLIFIAISLQDATLGFFYFLISIVIFIWKTLTSKIPLDTSRHVESMTLVYKKVGNKELKMDLWLPSDRFRKPYPLVYFCHGGGWISGFRNQPKNVSWCKYLATRGFAVVSIDYRYGFKNTMDDILSDYTDGLTFIKNKSNKFKIDKNNIILMGLSAGGHLSLLYSSYNSYTNNKSKMKGIKSVVAYYAPSNLKDIFDFDNKSIFARYSTTTTLKGSPGEEKQVYEYYSPINWVSDKMIQTLVVHGKLDTVVPFQSSINLVKKLHQYKIPYKFLVHNKGDHSFDTKMNDYSTINIIDKTLRFMKISVKKGFRNEDY